MLIRQGFKYALRLSQRREAILRRWVGCRRFVFNEALVFQKVEIQSGRRRPDYEALSARLPELKKQYPWLCEPPAQALQQALKDLCAAWDRKFAVLLTAFHQRLCRYCCRLAVQPCPRDRPPGRTPRARTSPRR